MFCSQVWNSTNHHCGPSDAAWASGPKDQKQRHIGGSEDMCFQFRVKTPPWTLESLLKGGLHEKVPNRFWPTAKYLQILAVTPVILHWALLLEDRSSLSEHQLFWSWFVSRIFIAKPSNEGNVSCVSLSWFMMMNVHDCDILNLYSDVLSTSQDSKSMVSNLLASPSDQVASTCDCHQVGLIESTLNESASSLIAPRLLANQTSVILSKGDLTTFFTLSPKVEFSAKRMRRMWPSCSLWLVHSGMFDFTK